jgi:hypothetical protein
MSARASSGSCAISTRIWRSAWPQRPRDRPARERKGGESPVEHGASDALSIQKKAGRPMEGRKVAILFAEGSDKAAIDRLKRQIEKAGGTAFLVAPKVGGIPVKGGTLKADGQLAGSPSVLFDAVASVLTAEQAEALAKQGAAVQWFMDALAIAKRSRTTRHRNCCSTRRGSRRTAASLRSTSSKAWVRGVTGRVKPRCAILPDRLSW